MWLSDLPLRRFAAVLAMLALAGYFRPMYGQLNSPGDSASGAQPNGSPSVVERLRRVDVSVDESRIGQKVRNDLIYAFNGGTAATDSGYKLTISLRQSSEDVILQRSGEAGTKFYELRANFTLIDANTGRVLHGGSAVSRTSYDRSDQIFANQRAALDAEDRAARVIAGTIRTRIAAYFAVGQ